MSKKEKFCAGPSIAYATRGISEMPPHKRRGHSSYREPISEHYGCDIGEEASSIINRIYKAEDGTKLLEAADRIGLGDVDDYGPLYAEATGLVENKNDHIGIGEVLGLLDKKLSSGLAPREEDAKEVSKKTSREDIYVPELVNNTGESGTVYMAKSLTSSNKVDIAWGLHEDNAVVAVDDYQKWEALLGWRKLKELPHGRKKIREELGDALSDDVLDKVAPEKRQRRSSTTSRTKTTRNTPSTEEINVALSTRHKERSTFKASTIKSKLDGDVLRIGYSHADYLVLFPTTCDKNMTSYWWVAGKTGGGTRTAVATCNKGTFEYLDELDNVMHIDEYLAQAENHEFRTVSGMKTFSELPDDEPVFHFMSDDVARMVLDAGMMEQIDDVLPEYIENNVYYTPEVPEDSTYAILQGEDTFWLRPLLRNSSAFLVYSNISPTASTKKNIQIKSMYELYAHARLDEWDHDAIEMKILSDVSHAFDLDEGGYELIQTLGKLHDSGKQLYSESPKSRWSE